MNMQQPTGHAAVLKINLGTGKWEAEFQGTILASSPDKNYIKNTIAKGLNKTANACGVTHVIELNETTMNSLVGQAYPQAPQEPKYNFSITERFGFYEETVQMVIDGDRIGALVTGDGGLGKSHTCFEVIDRNGLDYTYQYEPPAEVKKGKKDADADAGDEDEEEEIAWVNPGKVHLVKGYSSAKGLYRALFENNGKIIVFDDCDSIQKDPNAVNLLKGALDTRKERVVSWNAELGRGSNKLPMSFIFTGRIIFISNLDMRMCNEALKTRCSKIDLAMTAAEKIERMGYIITRDSYLPEISMEVKEDALAFLDKYKEDTTDLSLRSLEEVAKYRNRGNDNWERHALYALVTG
jgi:hypothetical protein